MRKAILKMPTEFSPLPIYESLTLNLTSVLNKSNNRYNKVLVVFSLLFTFFKSIYLQNMVATLFLIPATLKRIKTTLLLIPATLKELKITLLFIAATLKGIKIWLQYLHAMLFSIKTLLFYLHAILKLAKTILHFITSTIMHFKTGLRAFISTINTDLLQNSTNFLLVNFLKTNLYEE